MVKNFKTLLKVRRHPKQLISSKIFFRVCDFHSELAKTTLGIKTELYDSRLYQYTIPKDIEKTWTPSPEDRMFMDVVCS